MDKRRGLMLGLVLAAASGFIFYFFTSPFLNQQGGQFGGPLIGSGQDTSSISTLESDIDGCVSTPTSDCDQEMLQISKYCQQNKGQDTQVCSDVRVQQYVDQRGLNRPTINTGQ